MRRAKTVLGWFCVAVTIAVATVGVLRHLGDAPARAGASPSSTGVVPAGVTPRTSKAQACGFAVSFAICESAFTECGETAPAIVWRFLNGPGTPDLDHIARAYANSLYANDLSTAGDNQSAWTGCFDALGKEYATMTAEP